MKTRIGIIGLGKIGGALAAHARRQRIAVVGYRRSGVQASLRATGVRAAADLNEFVKNLRRPRLVFVYIPAGPAVDKLLDDLVPLLSSADIVVDGGNSYWGDSIDRARRLDAHGIHFLDMGTSGGIPGAKDGACFMVGGPSAAFRKVRPILDALALDPKAVIHTGPSGTGHYVKLVHNGIEFGMMEAIGEGIDLLTHHPAGLDITKILRNWNHGSVIRSWLLQLLEGSYRDKTIRHVPPRVEDTGEVNWLVEDALRMEVPIPVIAQSVQQLFTNRDRQGHGARAVARMRNRFGGHPFGRAPAIRKERIRGRVRRAAPRRLKPSMARRPRTRQS